MRIAFVGLRGIGHNTSGGIESAIEELSTRYARLGHEVTVFCRRRYTGDEAEFEGVRLRALPAIYTKHLEAISNTLVAVILSLRGYDIVHINATGPALLAFLPRLFHRRVVVTVHGLDWKREKWNALARLVLRLGARAAITFPHRTIVVSRTLKHYYKEKYGKDVEYIPNGVDLPLLGKDLTHDQDGHILFLSRLVPEKGCHTLIEAFRQVLTDRKLLIVGDPCHSEAYNKRLRRLADGDSRIVFAGALYDLAKDEAFRNAYLFVLPSTIEGMALALLEAMSYARCCVCSDIDENLEVVDSPAASNGSAVRPGPPADGPAGGLRRYGVSFRSGDANDLKEKLEFLLARPDLVGELGRKAREHVAAHLGWDKAALDNLRVYEDVLSEGITLPAP